MVWPRSSEAAAPCRRGPSRCPPRRDVQRYENSTLPESYPRGSWASGRSVAGVPDQGEGILVVLPGRTAEIGIEGAGSELGRGHREANIFALRDLAGADPAATEFGRSGQHPVVGLLAGLAAIGHD